MTIKNIKKKKIIIMIIEKNKNKNNTNCRDKNYSKNSNQKGTDHNNKNYNNNFFKLKYIPGFARSEPKILNVCWQFLLTCSRGVPLFP